MIHNPFNPPTKVDTLITKNEMPWRDILLFVQEELKLDPSQLEKIIDHGGLYAHQQRLEKSDLKKSENIPKGTPLKIYRFLKEPEPIHIKHSDILFEDQDLLAVNKPAWLPVQGTRVSRTYSLEAQLKKEKKLPLLMAAHRLDRQTSGVILFGKNKKSTATLMKLFENNKINKNYWALVEKNPDPSTGTITGYLKRDFRKLPLDVFRLSGKQTKDSKWSETFYQVVQSTDKKTLVMAKPITGRTHQIRVHLASLGCSIIGDTIYGPFAAAKAWGNPRIQLHAKELELPWNNKLLKLTAPTPSDFLWK